MSEWIDIKERKPPVGERVLARLSDGYTWVTDSLPLDVTHWMPLPAPPPKRVDPKDAIPGRWYVSRDGGRLLCVGIPPDHVSAWPCFAFLNPHGQYELRWRGIAIDLYETEIQSWEEK